MTLHHSTSLEQCTCVKFVPLSLRKPHIHSRIAVDRRGNHRSDEHVITEHILTAEAVCLRSLRIVIIHWAAERKSFIISLAGHCIDVRSHFITLTNGLADHIGIFGCEHPWLLVESTVL